MEKKKNQSKKNEDIEVNFKINKKKLVQGVGIVAALVAVLLVAFVVSKNHGANSYQFVNITIDEYLEMLKSEEKQIVYVARPSCSFCVKETPILKRVAGEYNLKVYYLDTEDFYDAAIQDYTEDGYKFISSSEKYANGFGTPNTIIIQNGEIIDGEFQYVEADALKDLFVRNGFINE